MTEVAHPDSRRRHRIVGVAAIITVALGACGDTAPTDGVVSATPEAGPTAEAGLADGFSVTKPCTLDWSEVGKRLQRGVYPMAAASSGTLFLGGNTTTSKWFAMRSDDGAASWIDVDDFELANGQTTAGIWGMVAVDQKVVMMVGESAENIDGGVLTHGVVRRSDDGGIHWITDRYEKRLGKATHYRGAAADHLGTIYLAGGAVEDDGLSHWIVRRSADHGVTFTDIDDFAIDGTGSATARGVAVGRDGAIYACGNAFPPAGMQWTLRRAARPADGGSPSFVTIDSPAPVPGVCGSLAVDDAGNAFGGGSGVDGVHYSWLIRRLRSGATVDELADAPFSVGPESGVNHVLIDATGAVMASGYGPGADGHTHALVRRSVDAGQTWTTTLDMEIDGSDTYGSFLTKDAVGNVYAVIAGAYKDVPDGSPPLNPTVAIMRYGCKK